jgi:hypothetical protein
VTEAKFACSKLITLFHTSGDLEPGRFSRHVTRWIERRMPRRAVGFRDDE